MTDIRITTASGQQVVLAEGVIEEFEHSLRGEMLRQSDDGYDEARAVYNAMIDKHPSLIVRCAGVADVINTVNFARTNQLLVAVRGAGHNVGGFAVCDGGIVIDLSQMKGMRIDPPAPVNSNVNRLKCRVSLFRNQEAAAFGDQCPQPNCCRSVKMG